MSVKISDLHINEASIFGCWQSTFSSMPTEDIFTIHILLQELVDLKMIKDTQGKTDDYANRQPIAWKQAIEFLKQFQHL